MDQNESTIEALRSGTDTSHSADSDDSSTATADQRGPS